jgi:hypothetical protein
MCGGLFRRLNGVTMRIIRGIELSRFKKGEVFLEILKLKNKFPFSFQAYGAQTESVDKSVVGVLK